MTDPVATAAGASSVNATISPAPNSARARP